RLGRCKPLRISSEPAPERSAATWLQHRPLAKQADLEIQGAIDDRAVCRKPSVSDAENKLGAHHPLDVDAVDDLLDRRKDLAGELEFAKSKGSSLAWGSQPAEKKAEQLPERVKTEAARHHWITLEMAGEEPEVGAQIQHRANQPLAVLPAGLRDF